MRRRRMKKDEGSEASSKKKGPSTMGTEPKDPESAIEKAEKKKGSGLRPRAPQKEA